MEDKLKQSEQAREQLAKELVRTKVSLEFADNTIKKQQENMRELNTENKRLNACLQEIKAIAEELLEKGLEPQSVEHQLRLKGKRELASIILDLITKAGSEEE